MHFKQRPFCTQPIAIAAAVVLLHVGGLYALQSGLPRRAAEMIVPVEILSQLIEPPKPAEPPPPSQPKPTPTRQPRMAKAPTPPPAPQPLAAIKDTAPVPPAPVGIAPPAPPAPPIEVAQAPAATPAAPQAPPAPPAPDKLELPSSNADYLNNPPPPYPSVSLRLGETGKVVVRVFISTEGLAQKGEVHTSSGFGRLDAAALAAALKWRYVPGKRGGVPEAMWVIVPVNFALD